MLSNRINFLIHFASLQDSVFFTFNPFQTCQFITAVLATPSNHRFCSFKAYGSSTNHRLLSAYPFSAAGSCLCNSLPHNVTSAPMLTVFRKRLKSYLFPSHFLPVFSCNSSVHHVQRFRPS